MVYDFLFCLISSDQEIGVPSPEVYEEVRLEGHTNGIGRIIG